jgi:predicted nucleic-acid-binding Zn-ribbon protein
MRSTQTCPKCAGRKFAISEEFRQPDHATPNTTSPFPAITIVAHRPAEERTGPWARKTVGTFETWICVGCGYTEFYAKGLDDIEALAKQHPDRLRILDAGSVKQGPYR